jgi:cbb3-type cytochrome oxidase maturation protein
MMILWILLGTSLVVLPGMALLALRWALRHGEFKHVDKAALSIFDEEEPLGKLSDHFPTPASTPAPSAGASDGPPALRPTSD